MKFTPVLFILIGIFSNFFGTFIVDLYGDLIGTSGFSVFDNAKKYFLNSLIDLIVVFIIIIIFYLSVLRKIRLKINNTRLVGRFDRWYVFFSLFLLLVSLFYILNLGDFNYSNRGVNQFEGRGVVESLKRATLLLFPIFIIYNLLWYYIKYTKLISYAFYFSSILFFFSYGNRIMFLLYSLVYLFMIGMSYSEVGKKTNKKKILLIILLLLSLITFIYYMRVSSYMMVSDYFIIGYIFYLVLDGTVGSIGVSYIYPQIKYYVASQTGLLGGASFLSYFIGLFIPSFFLYYLDLSEFYFRSSFYFNDLFNDNPNQGYDFMMVADFYWNFGYIGLFLYILVASFIIFLCSNFQKSLSPKYFGLSILISGLFVIGQRSDFGVFLKTSIYCSLFYLLLYYIIPKVKKNSGDF